ncbi:MAG: Beta-barrel assembly-enhancing protease [Bryobacteraceae bacterium]|nr:Beta-barrel assembly-enhancing protease [Bryobacteraceae bacterium]
MRRLSLIACILLLSTGVTYAQKQRKLKPGWNLFSPQQDIQLGKEAAAQVEKQVAIVDNRELTDYIAGIGKKLASQPEAGQFPYSFKVVYDKSINAFALPGGPAFVHTGLISAADNEAQMAGVLAHEISHVALRHGTSQVTKAQAVQLMFGLGGSLLGGGLLGQLAQLGAGLGANSLLLKFSRSAETEADLLGTRIMAKSGYDPVEMARFFEKLEAEEKSSGRSIPQFLSDHPSPGNRVKAVEAEIRLMPARQYSKGDSARLHREQAVVKSLPVPKKANTDFRNAGNPATARPSAQTKQYRSGGLAFSYPANWEIFQQDQANEITVASREGIVQSNGNAEIGYGAIIGVREASDAGNLEQSTRGYINQILQSNRTMQQSGQRQRSFQLSGAPALLNVFYSQSSYEGQREVDAIITARHPQGLFYMILISPEAEYSHAQAAFDQMIQSVQFAR